MKPVQNEFARCYYSDEWHSFLNSFLRSLLSLLAHALWDLASSRSPQFLEATRRKSDTNRRALSAAVAFRHPLPAALVCLRKYNALARCYYPDGDFSRPPSP